MHSPSTNLIINSTTHNANTTGPPTNDSSLDIANIADTGCTNHYGTIASPLILNKRPDPQPISVKMPNGQYITSTHIGELPIPNLPPSARTIRLFPSLTDILVSIGQLCDVGCVAIQNAHTCQIQYKGTVVLEGTRDCTTDYLWHFSFEPPTQIPLEHKILNATPSATPAERVLYAHATLFSPVPQTLQTALSKGYIHNFPGLSLQALKQHPPHTPATAKGHLDQTRQNQRSTKQATQSPFLDIPTASLAYDPDDENFPPASAPGLATNHCYAALWDTQSGKVFSDLTGRFLVPSSTGNNYIFLLYDYDSNTINVRPTPSKHASCILTAYKDIHDMLVRRGCRPQLHKLDNECSQLLKDFMATENTQHQLVPPGIHRRNAAERAIRTFKNHFIAGLCTTDSQFPLHLWDHLLPQAELTLNLLRGSRLNPKLSAHEFLHGRYDFNATPIAPPGIHVVAHEKPDKRASWATHGKDAWYVGPALEHYRCYTLWIWDTQDTRHVDTVSWFPPAHIKMPIASTSDLILAGMADLTRILQQPLHQTLDPLTDSDMATLARMTEILIQRSAPALTPHQPPPQPAPNPDATQLRVPLETYTNANKPLSSRTPALPSTSLRRSPRNHVPKANHAAAPPNQLDKATCHWLFTALEPEPPHAANKAINPDTGVLSEYPALLASSDGPLWEEANCKEFGRLAQGYKDTAGTDTMFFIPRDQIPRGRKATYLRVVCADRPHKEDPRRVRHTVGGDKIDYPFDVSTKTAGLVTAKIIINSTISTPGARFVGLDIKDFYLNNSMERHEYIRIPLSAIPQAIIDQYNLLLIAHNGYVYVEIWKGMYGLPQAGRIANDNLIPHLAQHGYIQSKRIPGLFTHQTRPVAFCLIVDDFGAKYVGKEHALHLEQVLKAKYTVTTDWTGSQFCGLTLDWDYENGHVDLSMPGYIEKALQRFHHNKTHDEHSPHHWIAPQYGSKQQSPHYDTTPPLNPTDIKTVQQIVGVLLYYGRALDNTVLKALNTIASAQSKGTEATLDACTRLLNYVATHPDAIIRFNASDMVLHIHADASYLSSPNAKSCAGGYFFLSTHPAKLQPNQPAPVNGALHVLCSLIGPVVASAAEAEVGAAFMCGQEGCPIRQTLIELGHPQPATPIQTDNECAQGILSDTVKQRRSKAIDMRFYWLQDRIQQNQYTIFWAPGTLNLADYFTKHHAPAHHKRVRSTYLYAPPPTAHNLQPTLQLCYLCEGVLKSQPLVQYHCDSEPYIHSHPSPHSEHKHDSTSHQAHEPGHRMPRILSDSPTSHLTQQHSQLYPTQQCDMSHLTEHGEDSHHYL